MKNVILYTVALNEQQVLVKAIDAEKSQSYFCPVCKGDLILRKSGKTGKNSKRPHFAHRTLTPNCTPETALHYSFKNLLAQNIDERIKSQKELVVSWKCKHCSLRHNYDLLSNVHSVKVEHNLRVCQPDIALFNNEGKVLTAIEVIVTHKPENQAIQFYRESEISLIEIKVDSDLDLEKIDEKVSNPHSNSFCINPKCTVCGNYMTKRTLWVIDGACWNCDEIMKVGVIDDGTHSYKGPDEFSDDEISLAKQHGVMIEQHYSRTVDDHYLANTCPQCGFFIGQFYLFQDYFSPAELGDYPSEQIEMGYYCTSCTADDESSDFLDPYL